MLFRNVLLQFQIKCQENPSQQKICCNCTNDCGHAMQRNHDLHVSPNEIEVLICTLLLTEYMTPKNIRMFWDVKSDTHNEAVTNSI